MSLRIKKSVEQRHMNDLIRKEKRKVFVLTEGEKTEMKYFEGLKDNARELGICDLLEIVPLYKSNDAKGITSPQGLVVIAEEFILESTNNGNYYESIDKFILVFDRDKDDFKNYKEFIDANKDKFILGITNPCFEIWLLLHSENSVEEIINVKKEEIIQNAKISRTHTFTSKLISDLYNMHTKNRMVFSKFKDDVSYAIAQEKKVEQDIYRLENQVGSNIGKIIQDELMRNSGL